MKDEVGSSCLEVPDGTGASALPETAACFLPHPLPKPRPDQQLSSSSMTHFLASEGFKGSFLLLAPFFQMGPHSVAQPAAVSIGCLSKRQALIPLGVTLPLGETLWPE